MILSTVCHIYQQILKSNLEYSFFDLQNKKKEMKRKAWPGTLLTTAVDIMEVYYEHWIEQTSCRSSVGICVPATPMTLTVLVLLGLD